MRPAVADRTLRSPLRSRRMWLALTSSAIASASNFAFTIAMAHHLDPLSFGVFAIAGAAQALAVGFGRAAVVEPFLAIEDSGAVRAMVHRSSLVGIVLAGTVALIGAVVSAPYFLILAVGLHGLTINECVRTTNMARLRPTSAVLQDASWGVGSVVAATTLFLGLVSPVVAYGIWVLSGALVGYVFVALLRCNPAPSWAPASLPTSTSLAFGADFLVGSGSALVTTNILGVVVGPTTVGALRAAGTVFGPITLLVSVGRTLAIPFLKRVQTTQPRSEFSVAVRVTALMALLISPLLVVLAFLPAAVGRVLLGENWDSAEPIMPYLAVELGFIVLTTAAFAGHRVWLAGRASLIVRSFLAVVRLAVVVAAAAWGGAVMAAAAMASVAFIGMIAWWSSYYRRTRSAVAHPLVDDPGRLR